MEISMWTRCASWLMLISFVVAESYFDDNPPLSFYNRTSIDDCPEIFYSKLELYPVNTLPAWFSTRAYSKEFQHMAAIGWTSNGKTEYLCGGTLITAKFVLTAAHCASNGNSTSPDTVRLGDTHLESTEDDEYAQQIQIRAFKRHPKHSIRKSYFDIALIELETEAKVTLQVCPACLWLEKDVPVDDMQSIGFGATEYADHSPTLQKVTLSAIDKQKCASLFSPNLRQFSDGIMDHQICAGSHSMDTCKGDSGGPMQVTRVNMEGNAFPLVVGVVSFGSLCTNGSLGIYTRVADFREWIESETKMSMDYFTCTSHTLHARNFSVAPVYNTYRVHPIFPFHRVSLVWNSSDFNNDQCGATVIDYQFAISSAFCIRIKQNLPKLIRIESTNETVEIDKIFIHPSYSSEHPENDLALLKLSKYLREGKNLLPMCIKRQHNISENYSVEFSVYWTKKEADHTSNHLKAIKASGSSQGVCKDSKYSRSNLLCARNGKPLIPTMCNMDYGGPVSYIDYTDEKQLYLKARYLEGVVSKLNKRCDVEFVGTWISSAHVDWIENIVLEQTNERFVFL